MEKPFSYYGPKRGRNSMANRGGGETVLRQRPDRKLQTLRYPWACRIQSRKLRGAAGSRLGWVGIAHRRKRSRKPWGGKEIQCKNKIRALGRGPVRTSKNITGPGGITATWTPFQPLTVATLPGSKFGGYVTKSLLQARIIERNVATRVGR